MLTEKDARENWCPHVRAAAGEIRSDNSSAHQAFQAAFNRIVDGRRFTFPLGGACFGSGCMAWRWFDGVTDDGTAVHRSPSIHAARTPEPKEGRPLNERRGFCGLAGKP